MAPMQSDEATRRHLSGHDTRGPIKLFRAITYKEDTHPL